MANLNELMASIAEAIRHKRNITDKINAQNFPDEIEKITGGGGSKNEPITITTNGVYTAPEGVGYSPINVSVKLEGNPLQYVIDNRGGNGKPSCYYLFYHYLGKSLDSVLSQCDFSKVTDMQQMFYQCFNLTTIPLINTSNVTKMNGMFNDCSSLTTIPQLDTSKVTTMANMFNDCNYLTAIPELNTSSCTDMGSMFSSCYRLVSIPQLDTSNVTDMYQMFYRCNITAIPQLNTSNVTNMTRMFYMCQKLTTIPQLDTSNATDMDGMFEWCIELNTIPQLNTSKAIRMNQMFAHCASLTTIDITHMNTSGNSEFASYCCSLIKLIIRNMNKIPVLSSNAFSYCYHFTGKVNTTYNPNGLKDGRIYVPDDKVEALKIATNWSIYADIIVPLSLLDATSISDINTFEDEEGNIINIDNLSYEEVQ